MKKLIFSALALVALGTTAKAQDAAGLKAGIHIGAPMGDASDLYSLNFGADVAYTWQVSEIFSAGITTGYTYFSGKEIDTGFGKEKFNASFVPVAATGQVSIAESLFVGADLGYAFYTGDGDADGSFYYQPKFGYASDFYEVYLAYKGFSTDGSSINAINLGFNYKF